MTLRERISNTARSPWAYPVSVLLGFLEGTFIIVAMEPLFIPLMAVRVKKAWAIVASLLLGNVLGALFMYAAGALIAGSDLVPWLGGGDALATYEEMSRRLEAEGFFALFAIGVTPFPFQIGTAAAGAVDFPIWLFILAISLSRAIRYFGLALIVTLIGARARDWLEKHELEIFVGGLLIFVLFGLIVFLG